MASLLSKFRIDYASLTMVEDITAKPKPETEQLFSQVLKEYSGKKDGDSEEPEKGNPKMVYTLFILILHNTFLFFHDF